MYSLIIVAYIVVEMDLNKLPKPRAVIVLQSFGITKGFQKRVCCTDRQSSL